MAFPVIRSRLLRTTTTSIHGSGRLLSTSTTFPRHFSSSSADPLSASSFNSAAASSTLHESSGTSPPSSPPSAPGSPFLKFLKFSLITAFTGAAATIGYASYAYTVEEVEEKAKTFRASTNIAVADDASFVDKIQASVFSTAMKASVEAIDLYLEYRRKIEERVRDFTEPMADKLLPDLPPHEQLHLYTLVLDLSETLIHSDWKRERGWRTFKRPGLDAFLDLISQYYEVVVYSDQMNTYVDDIVGRLNTPNLRIHYALGRAATKYQNGQHFRDFSKLNRDPSRIIYVSAHALENSLQSENCVQIKPWTPEDMNDTALLDLIPFLEFVARNGRVDTRQVIASYEGRDIAKEFIERSKEIAKRREEQKQKPKVWNWGRR